MTTKKTTKNKSSKIKASKKNNFKKELELEKDKNLRLFAEFENYRKRTAKERLELYSTANKDIMLVLLPILDNFERSIKANNYSDSDGPTLIYKQLKAELEKKGLKEMESPIGKELDTDFHEATANVPAPKKNQKGKIIDVIEKGYFLGEKIIRYAKVVVGN
ncbi:MAG: nucleotide exchange factor GrpE [Flavobacteriales bacterium]|nr:nucleotide exchange factor GrpE [Flavobacteriales bacterium]|tara:strand:- start:9807 stop:10292 length:486 start_codon:yes stop_codon:yes gene_type:complete